MFSRSKHFIGLGALLAVYLGFGVVFAFETRLFRAPDERMHWWYVTELGAGRLPIVTDDPVSHLAHQPPLYYLAAQPVYLLSRPFSLDTQVRSVRIWSLIMASLIIPLVFLLARQLLPTRPWAAWVATASVALNPQYIFMSSLVNNDALTNVLGAGLAVSAVSLTLGNNLSRLRMVGLSLLLAAALLTKVILWPLITLVVGIAVWKLRRDWKNIGWIVAPLGLAGLWWGWRNTMLYQDPTAWRLLSDRWAAEQGRDWMSLRGIYHWFNTLIESFWARFGYFNLGLVKPYYQTVKAVLLLAGLGLGAFIVDTWRTLTRPQRQAWAVTWAFGLIVLSGVFVYSLTFYQPQGRYLFAAAGPIAVSLAAGLTQIVPTRKQWLVLAAVVIGLWSLDWASWQVIARRG